MPACLRKPPAKAKANADNATSKLITAQLSGVRPHTDPSDKGLRRYVHDFEDALLYDPLNPTVGFLKSIHAQNAFKRNLHKDLDDRLCDIMALPSVRAAHQAAMSAQARYYGDSGLAALLNTPVVWASHILR